MRWSGNHGGLRAGSTVGQSLALASMGPREGEVLGSWRRVTWGPHLGKRCDLLWKGQREPGKCSHLVPMNRSQPGGRCCHLYRSHSCDTEQDGPELLGLWRSKWKAPRPTRMSRQLVCQQKLLTAFTFLRNLGFEYLRAIIFWLQLLPVATLPGNGDVSIVFLKKEFRQETVPESVG